METRNHPNGAEPKSYMSREKTIKYYIIMKNLFVDSQTLTEKLVNFSQNSLNEKEQVLLDTVLAVYKSAISKENALTVLGVDAGFLTEIDAAIEKEGEITMMTTPTTALTPETPVIVGATVAATKTIMNSSAKCIDTVQKTISIVYTVKTITGNE
jgi:hypothetical protein